MRGAMSDELVWEDPPETSFRHAETPWMTRLEPLVARPMTWARICTCKRADLSASTAGYLRRVRSPKPPGRWEFCSRTKDGHYYVYARYLGPAENGNGSEP